MRALDLYMNSFLVGTLTKKKNGALFFSYAESWLNTPGTRPLSLSLPLQHAAFEGDRVSIFFDHLLPDSIDIRQRIVARFQASSIQAFDLLEKIGADTVGAIQFIPRGISPRDYHMLTFEPLNNQQLSDILKGYQSQHPLGMINSDDDFRISLAGAQEKTALLYYQGQWCKPTGVTPTSHIIKLSIGQLRTHSHTLDLSDSVENEYLCLQIAKAYGLSVPDAQILYLDGIKALAVERFDRLWNKQNLLIRRPQEDCCQALGIPSGIKYEKDGGPGISEIMSLLQGSMHALSDRYRFMQAQVLFWLLAATDGHAKNFSIFIGLNGNYELSPLYDIISLDPVLKGKGGHIRDAKLAMSLKGSKGKKYAVEQIRARHFLATADGIGFSLRSMQEILNQFIESTPMVVAKIRHLLPKDFPMHIADSILHGLETRVTRLKTNE